MSVLVTCCYFFCSFHCLACFWSRRILLFSIVDCDNSLLWKQLLCNCNYCSTGLLVVVRQCTRSRRFLIIIIQLMLVQCSLCCSLVRRLNRLKMKFRIVSFRISSLSPFLSFFSLAKLVKNSGTCENNLPKINADGSSLSLSVFIFLVLASTMRPKITSFRFNSVSW